MVVVVVRSREEDNGGTQLVTPGIDLISMLVNKILIRHSVNFKKERKEGKKKRRKELRKEKMCK